MSLCVSLYALTLCVFVQDDDLKGHSDDDDDDDGGKEEEEWFAVKKIKKAKFHHLSHRHKMENVELLRGEIRLLEQMQRLKAKEAAGSSFVIDLIDVFEDRNYLYIVTNFCEGTTCSLSLTLFLSHFTKRGNFHFVP